MQHKFRTIAGIASLSLFLAACGSSSDEEVVLVPNATSSGIVSGFGSVYVNGLRYVTQDSSIIKNGIESSEEALKVGMKVVIKANQSLDNDPTALEVKYLADAIGIIDSIDLADPSLRILGQTYFVSPMTKFDGTPFNELRIGMAIELSAFENETGRFVINYLTTKDDLSEYQLSGTVSQLKKLDKSFVIGDLSIDYAQADVQGTLYDGSTVAIKSNIAPINNEFLVDEVSVQGMLLYIGGTLTVAGFVEDINKVAAGTVIELDGRNYLLSDDSDFSQGNEDDLRVGEQVNLIATVIDSDLESPYYPIETIRVELANEISLEGIVSSITDKSFTLFGQEFFVDEYTLYEDDSEQGLRHFNFSGIAINDKLAVDAYETNGLLISRKIEREETGASELDSYDINGLVDSIDTDNLRFSVKGITVLTNGDTQYENAQGQSLNQDDFFLSVVKGDEVEVEVTSTANGWLALDIEIDGKEKDDDVELLGIVDTFTNIFNFTVNGHQVITNRQTDFENGSASDLVKHALIKVEGKINTDGALVAEEIEFIDLSEN